MPSIVVAAIDDEVNISMFFSFTEEETKEHEVKCELDVDDFFPTNYFLLARSFDNDISRRINIDNFLNSLYDPGIIVPPPEFK
ncbi:hypothetical protein [Cyclobacterium amurskyense]|jgi:hypothetical protein|nr:hypothetical protein [Cyclobacterium amurskyense]|tara:strand:- start:3211 stop:3459 length:249 start_codon:yes stop_codon:yes gene_type:complete